MKVILIASTQLHPDEMGNPRVWEQLPPRWSETEQNYIDESDYLAEFAGRACYQSWNRPNAKTSTNKTYLAHINEVGHYSVLEHASATFYVEGVSRSLTHELVRHRHLSYSQLSQRYVDESDSDVVMPPAMDPVELATLIAIKQVTKAAYVGLVKSGLNRGMSRKEARQMARSVLPNATETKIVVTGNMRAWRDMLQKRWHVAADAEIREFAGMILDQLRSIAPNTFQDIPGRPYGSEEQ
jgi:thymidylate synthase (FAD)